MKHPASKIYQKVQRYVFFVLHLGDEPYLRVAKELHYVANLLAVRNLLLYLATYVEYVVLTVEHQTVGIGYVGYDLLILAQTLHSMGVGTSILYGVVDGNDVWWHILGDKGIGTHHSVSAYAGIGIDYYVGREDDIVLYHHLACYLAAVAYYIVVAYVYVVADVHSLHEEIVVGYASGRRLILSTGSLNAGACYGDVFTYDVVVANDGERIAPMIFEILGYGTNNGAMVHLIILAHARTIHYTGEGIDDAIVAYLHITLDIGKRHNGHVLAELCLWVYVCFVGNHNLGSLL